MNLKESMKKKIISAYTTSVDKHESEIVNSVLEYENFEGEQNAKPQKTSNIGIIVGSIVRYSGGHTSILRLGTGLSKNGKTVTYISFKNQSLEKMQEAAKGNLPSVEGKFAKLQDVSPETYDIIIATSWQSVYYARRFEAYKMYFVQDYEPYFFKLNERYLLAKKTYELGLHIVSLGKWNIEQIKRLGSVNVKYKTDYIDFPYEPSEYICYERNYDKYIGKKDISIAVYSKEDGKRIPNMLQIILKKATKELQSMGISLEIYFFGFDKKTKIQIGKNLGKLNRKEMIELYKKVDFGMVASMTNISLVPYEMLATGLPIIEFIEGSFTSFFPSGAATLVDFNYKMLCDELVKCITVNNIVKNQIQLAQKYLETLSWEHSCRQFIDILEEL